MGAQCLGPETLPSYPLHTLLARPLNSILLTSPTGTAGTTAIRSHCESNVLCRTPLNPALVPAFVVQPAVKRRIARPRRGNERIRHQIRPPITQPSNPGRRNANTRKRNDTSRDQDTRSRHLHAHHNHQPRLPNKPQSKLRKPIRSPQPSLPARTQLAPHL